MTDTNTPLDLPDEEAHAPWPDPAPEAADAEPAAAPELVDLNTATIEELTTLPRIGPGLAQRIIEYRETVRPFEEPVEITAVPGIAEATYEEIKGRLVVGALAGIAAEPPPEFEPPDIALAVEDEPEALPPLDMIPPPEAEPEEVLPLEIGPPPEAEPAPVPPPPRERPPVYERVIERRTGWLGVIIATLLGGLLGAALTLLALWALNGTLDFNRLAAITNLEQDNNLQDQRLDLIGGDVDTLSGQWGEVDSHMADLGQQIEALGAQQREMETALQETRGRLERAIASLSDVNGRMDGLAEAVGAVESSLSGLEDKFSAVTDQLAAIEAEAARFGAFLDGLRELLNASSANEDQPAPATEEAPARVTVTPGLGATPRPTATSAPTPTPSSN